jgi:hypothetical protein
MVVSRIDYYRSCIRSTLHHGFILTVNNLKEFNPGLDYLVFKMRGSALVGHKPVDWCTLRNCQDKYTRFSSMFRQVFELENSRCFFVFEQLWNSLYNEWGKCCVHTFIIGRIGRLRKKNTKHDFLAIVAASRS